MRLRLFFLFIIQWILMIFPLSGQKVVIHEDLRGDTVVPDYGMNRKHFVHFYAGSHFVIGKPEVPSSRVRNGVSGTWDLGIRYKLRYSHFFSGGLEWSLRQYAYAPKDWGMAVFPESVHQKKERLKLTQTGLGVYQRINYQRRRGDYIGRFIDIGVYGNLCIASSHAYGFINTANEKVKVKISRLSYIQPFEYGVLARLGFNNFVLKGSFRLSDHFKDNSGLTEFPRLLLGLELGFHPK